MSSYENRQYFVPGYAISRHIIFSHIQIYLGPYATVRPYSYRGREGYLVSAPGQPLTRSQIEDLQSLSRQYELQAAERMTSAAYSYNQPSYSGSAYGGSSETGNSENSARAQQQQEEMYINQPVIVQGRRR